MIPPTVGNSILEVLRRRLDYLYERFFRAASATSEAPIDVTPWNPNAIGLFGVLANSDGFVGPQMKRRSEGYGSFTKNGDDIGGGVPTTCRFLIEAGMAGTAAIPVIAWESDLSGLSAIPTFRFSPTVIYRLTPSTIPEGIYLEDTIPGLPPGEEISIQARWFLWELA